MKTYGLRGTVHLFPADELQEVDVDGQRAWLPANEADAACPPLQGMVHLLPHFDCYMIGCHPRDRLVPAWAQRALTRGSAGTVPVMLVDGVVAGIWQHHRSGRRVELRVEPFRPLSANEHHALEAAVARVREIWEAEPVLLLTTVDARPHL